MDIQIYEDAANREQWLEQLKNCDWKAGAFLYSLLKENRFHGRYGKKAKVLLLTDGTKLASFCTYAEKDEIPDTERKPWIGFVYTYPEYRGRRLMGKLIARVKELAREDGYDTVYVSTREQGLYEKYGAEFVAEMKDTWGEDSRVFRMNTYGFTAGRPRWFRRRQRTIRESARRGTCIIPCGMYGKKKPAHPGCSRTGAKKTGRWASAPSRPSWHRISSAERYGAFRWKTEIITALTQSGAACLT